MESFLSNMTLLLSFVYVTSNANKLQINTKLSTFLMEYILDLLMKPLRKIKKREGRILCRLREGNVENQREKKHGWIWTINIKSLVKNDHQPTVFLSIKISLLFNP